MGHTFFILCHKLNSYLHTILKFFFTPFIPILYFYHFFPANLTFKMLALNVFVEIVFDFENMVLFNPCFDEKKNYFQFGTRVVVGNFH